MAVHPSSSSADYDDDYYDSSTAHPESTTRLASKHTTEGYRDGIAASKQLHVQEGFDEGYILGAALGLKVGELLGVLDGLLGTVTGLLSRSNSGNSSNGGDSERLAEQLNQLRKVRRTAKQELALETVFGKDYFGGDGIWKWSVADESGDAAETTFDDIVLQHPLVVKWSDIIELQARQLGLELTDRLDEEAADDS